VNLALDPMVYGNSRAALWDKVRLTASTEIPALLEDIAAAIRETMNR
jgi:hypothetical protein